VRHTRAGYLIADGVPDMELQRYIGHTDIRTTKNIYGHLFPDSIRQAAATRRQRAGRRMRSPPRPRGCARVADRDIRMPDRSDQGGNVAESHPRSRSWATIAAFALIIAVEIGEGIDEGFDIWNWVLIALGAVFIAQAAYRLQT
jgi:hypothetical protein